MGIVQLRMARAARLCRRAAVSVFGVVSLLGAEALAAHVVASLPQTLYWGPPRGSATMAGVGWNRANRAEELPRADGAQSAWQRQIAGGIFCNLLVDARGSIFAVGLAGVTQLAADGQREFSQQSDLSSAVAAALLGDGTRVVLSREGQLRAWSARGATVFKVDLAGARRWTNGGLLPLPDGGLLVHGGAWLIDLDAEGSVRTRARLERRVEQTLLANGRIIAVDDQGDVYEWNGQDLLVSRGSLGGRPTAVALRESSDLVGLVGDRSLVELSLMTGNRRELANVTALGLLPVLSIPAPGRVYGLRSDGTLFTHDGNPPSSAITARVSASPLPRAPVGVQLLGSPHGAASWLAANVPLRLDTGLETEHEIQEIRCAEPISLVPAGPRRLAVACRNGQIWLVDQGTEERKPGPGHGPAPGVSSP